MGPCGSVIGYLCVNVLTVAAAANLCLLIRNARPVAHAADPVPGLHTGVRAHLRSHRNTWKVLRTHTVIILPCILITNVSQLQFCTSSDGPFPISCLVSFSYVVVSGGMYPSHHWGEWNDSQLLPTIQKLMKGYNRYLRPNFNGRNAIDN